METDENTFLVQGNLIENNSAGGDVAGGGRPGPVITRAQGTGLFTWNIVRGNRADVLLTYGTAGGLFVGGGPLELSHNIYANNQIPRRGRRNSHLRQRHCRFAPRINLQKYNSNLSVAAGFM